MVEASFFTLTKTSPTGIRQGLLSGHIPTPNYLTFTRKGGVPIISPKHFGYLGLQLFQFSYADIVSFQDILKPFKEYYHKKFPEAPLDKLHTLAQYTSMPSESISYLSFGDVVDAKIQGGSKGDTLEIISQKHKQSVNSHTYSQFVAMANPDMYVTPSEIVEPGMGKKRRARAAKQSVKMVEHCLHERKEPGFPLESKLIAPVILQSDELEGCPEVKKLAGLPDVDGYLFCGFSGTPMSDDKISLLRGVENALGYDKKIRIYQGDGNPVEILFGILNGVDLFESWYPFKLAEGKFALDLSVPEESKVAETTLSIEEKKEMKEMFVKKEVKYVDFNEKAEEGKQVPIQKNCECFTCKNHTRAYIDHLVQCDEMNWQMLLAMYCLFFVFCSHSFPGEEWINLTPSN